MKPQRLGRLSESGNFLKYFQLSVPSFSLSLKMLTDLFSRWSSLDEAELIKELEQLSQTSNVNAVLRAFQNDFSATFQEASAKRLCHALTKTAHRFGTRDMSRFFDSPYYAAVGVVLGLIDKRVPRGEIPQFIDSIVSDAPFNTLITDLVEVCAPPRQTRTELYNIRDDVDAEHVVDMGVQRFDKLFLNDKVDIFEVNAGAENAAYVLNRWSTKWKTSPPDKAKVSPYLIEMIKKEEKRLLRFILGCANRTNGEVSDFDKGPLVDQYDINQLLEVANKLNRKDFTSPELAALDKFIATFSKS